MQGIWHAVREPQARVAWMLNSKNFVQFVEVKSGV
jgi:hypothetical protein